MDKQRIELEKRALSEAINAIREQSAKNQAEKARNKEVDND